MCPLVLTAPVHPIRWKAHGLKLNFMARGIWKSLYDRFGLDFDSSMDLSQPDEYWRRYLYFNAGFFYHRDAHEFGKRFLHYARDIRDNPSPETECQELNP